MTRIAVGEVIVDVTMPLAKDHGFRSWVFSPMTDDMWLLRVKTVGIGQRLEYIGVLVHNGLMYDLPHVTSRKSLRENVARVVLGFEPLDG